MIFISNSENFFEYLPGLLKEHDLVKYFDNDGKLIMPSIINDLRHYDTDLLNILLTDKFIINNYSKVINGKVLFDFKSLINLFKYHNFWQDSYTKFSNRIGLTTNGHYLNDDSDVVLSFPFKDSVLKAGMTKENQKSNDFEEPYLNEVISKEKINEMLEPKVLNNIRRYDNKGNLIDLGSFNSSGENMIIKGNNLIALYSIDKRYEHKVDVIYIDPPYNVPSSNNTFVYNNNFNQSTWLTFMKNRLQISKKLLKPENGALIIAIDENEVNYLGVMLDEMFTGYEKHLITVIHNPRGVQGTNFSYTNEFLYFVFPKGKKIIGDRKLSPSEIKFSNLRNWGGESLRNDGKNTFFPIIVNKKGEIIGFGDVCDDNYHPNEVEVKNNNYYVYPIDSKGKERKWRYAYQTINSVKRLLKPQFKKDRIEIMIGKDFGQYKTVWQSSLYDSSVYGKQLLKRLVPNSDFSFPKSIYSVYDALYAVIKNRKNALVLDYFAGSGTTAHAVQMLNKNDNGNRHFISIEQMPYAKSVEIPRLNTKTAHKRNDGFIYAELMDKNQRFINSLEKANTQSELDNLYECMKKHHADLDIHVDLRRFEKEKDKYSFTVQQQILIHMINKNQLYYNYHNLDDENLKGLISKDDYKFNQSFYDGKGDK